MESYEKLMYDHKSNANDSSRERLPIEAAPKEQAGNGESLRQKYLYWTQLWRELNSEPPKGKLASEVFPASLDMQGNSQVPRTEEEKWAPLLGVPIFRPLFLRVGIYKRNAYDSGAHGNFPLKRGRSSMRWPR